MANTNVNTNVNTNANTNVNFMRDEHKIKLVLHCKYLGLLLDEHMQVDQRDELFGRSAGKAICLLL